MKQQTFGATVAALRKERGMTQLELKWEREVSQS